MWPQMLFIRSTALLLLICTDISCCFFLHEPLTHRRFVESTRLFVKARATDIGPVPSSSYQHKQQKQENNKNDDPSDSSNDQRRRKLKNRTTVSDLQKELLNNPSNFQFVDANGVSGQKKSRRSRRKVETPKQTYMYAWQRRLQQNSTALPAALQQQKSRLPRPRQMGCDPNPFDVPICRHEILIDEDGARAFVLEKPPGWAILGNRYVEAAVGLQSTPSRKSKVDHKKDQGGDAEISFESLEREKKDFDRFVKEHEDQIMAVMTPEELAAEGLDIRASRAVCDVDVESFEQDFFEDDSQDDSSLVQSHNNELPETSEARNNDPKTAENLRRIQVRTTVERDTSIFVSQPIRRPSLISWLKDYVSETTGMTIRGGTNWKAVAGATAIDDSGLVLVAPRSLADRVFVEAASYVAVGTSTSNTCRTVSVLRAHRNNDVVQTMEFDQFAETVSTCDDVAALCESVRGAEEQERKAPRRLIHCQSLSVSTEFSFVAAKTESIPSDIQIYANRGASSGNQYGFTKGSFRGREALRDSNHTTAYREINGAADGFPGWTVDRYNQWLIVYHDPSLPKGPLPSIHDGYTAGVYYVEKSRTSELVRPKLLEGKAAPETFVILENGIKYSVSLYHDLSTGIFLDQRPQRAWLSQHCTNYTRVLNTFAHTGAFGVAAAVAGASTVNIDSNRKWLDRFPRHLEANGIEFNERHDCIYGDCFDWLKKLAKRNEKYDIVILDPPSSSIGTDSSRRRWSVMSDTAELVKLAAQLVYPGGYLWTTTNCASLAMQKFAKMVQTGAPCATLERIQPMPVDFPSVGPQNVKNLVWKIRQ